MKSTLKALFVLPILVALTSCSTAQKLTDLEVANTYVYFPLFEFHYSMEIHEDGTFKFRWKEGLLRGETIGTWYRKGTRLIFNSKVQLPPKGPAIYEIKQTSNAPSDSLEIKLTDDNGETIPFVNVELKKGDRYIEGAATNMNGIARVSRTPNTNLTFWSVGFARAKLKVDRTLSSYHIVLKHGDRDYKYFDEEVWCFRNGRMYPPKTRLTKISKIKYFEKKKKRATTPVAEAQPPFSQKSKAV